MSEAHRKGTRSRFLPDGFTPGIDHVVIGRGKKYCNHVGNLRLRSVVQSKLSSYLNAQSKSSKSAILTEVIHQMRTSSSSSGCFVRQDKDSGKWLEAEDYLAREKTSQAFRDALRHFYKSSRENKRKAKDSEHDEGEIYEEGKLGSLRTGGTKATHHQRRHEGPNVKKRRESFGTMMPLKQSQLALSTTGVVRETEIPALPLSFPASIPQTSSLSSSQHKMPNLDDNNLYTRLCSLARDTFENQSDENPFEPTPFRHNSQVIQQRIPQEEEQQEQQQSGINNNEESNIIANTASTMLNDVTPEFSQNDHGANFPIPCPTNNGSNISTTLQEIMDKYAKEQEQGKR